MKKIVSRINKQARLASVIGLKSYTRYRLTKKGSLAPIHINGLKIKVRKGTPDLDVAISCLNGEFEVLRNLLPKNYDGVIVDAGGYIGTAALALSQMFPNARIISIEPSLKNIDVLKENVKCARNVELIYGALVGSGVEKVSLKNRGTGEWGFTAVENPLDNQNAEILHETPAVTLKSLGVDINEIGMLKLDIEGGELDLLTNDLQSLEKIDIVFAELHDRIIDGCTKAFFDFSEDRSLIKDKGEKYLSIRK